jgi:hypothetical protein
LLYAEDDISALSDNEIIKFLVSRDMHLGRALEALAETLSWRKTYGTNRIMQEDFMHHEKSGKVSLFGKAMDNSVGMVLQANRFEALQTPADIDQNVRFIIYSLEKGRREGYINDKVTVIIDINGKKVGKQEIKLASQLVPLLQKHYPETLSRLYLFPTNTLFNMTYQMSSYLISKETIPKIKLCQNAASLAEFFNRDQYYEQFGGLAPDPIFAIATPAYSDSKGEIKAGDSGLQEAADQAKPMSDSAGLSKPDIVKGAIVKSAPINFIEEIFCAPKEYHSI